MIKRIVERLIVRRRTDRCSDGSYPKARRLWTRLLPSLLVQNALIVVGITACSLDINSLPSQRIHNENRQSTAISPGLRLRERWRDVMGSFHANSSSLGDAAPDPDTTTLLDLRQRYSAGRSAWLLDRGSQEGKTTPPPLLAILRDLPLRRLLAQGHATISPGRSAIQPCRVRRASGDLSVVSDAHVTPNRLLPMRYRAVVDALGHLMAGRRSSLPLFGWASQTSKSAMNPLAGFTHTHSVWYHTSIAGWYVIVEGPTILIAPKDWWLITAHLVLLLLGGASVLLLWRVNTTITQPIAQLHSAMVRFHQNFETNPALAPDKNKITHMAIMFDNLTQQFSAMQQKLLQQSDDIAATKQELERTIAALQTANLLKVQFLAMISHELRTPLTSVLGFADLLSTGLYGELYEEQQSAVGRIRESSHHLLQLINDLLDLSSLEAGKIELQEAPFDLDAEIAEVVCKCTPAACTKNIRIERVRDPAIPQQLYGDGARIRQIMLNLLSNAVKFTEQGKVMITAEWKPDAMCNPTALPARAVDEDTAHTSGAHLVIKVQDTGIGIAPAHQSLIFDEFRQIDGSYARRKGGIGLGLSITRKLVSLMGGWIVLDSSSDSGSCFIVTLPMRADDSLTTEQ